MVSKKPSLSPSAPQPLSPFAPLPLFLPPAPLQTSKPRHLDTSPLLPSPIQPSGPLINVLLVGGGGREHALAWKLKQSPRLGKLWITHPENPGLAALGTPVDEPIEASNAFRSKRFCEKHDIGLVVIGPEEPLAQ